MNKRILATVALAVSMPTLAAQIPASAIEECAAIAADASRLACYDQIAQTYPLSESTTADTQTVGTGKWTVDKKTNPMDDSKTVHISLVAASGNSKYGKPIMLVAHCDSKKKEKTEMYINWQVYLGSGSETKVTLRIGANDATTSKWSTSSDRQRTVSYSPISTLKEMLMVDRVVAQVTPFNQDPYTAIFNVSGLEEATKSLQEACVW